VGFVEALKERRVLSTDNVNLYVNSLLALITLPSPGKALSHSARKLSRRRKSLVAKRYLRNSLRFRCVKQKFS
jgi:hypothetical protein